MFSVQISRLLNFFDISRVLSFRISRAHYFQISRAFFSPATGSREGGGRQTPGYTGQHPGWAGGCGPGGGRRTSRTQQTGKHL